MAAVTTAADVTAAAESAAAIKLMTSGPRHEVTVTSSQPSSMTSSVTSSVSSSTVTSRVTATSVTQNLEMKKAGEDYELVSTFM